MTRLGRPWLRLLATISVVGIVTTSCKVTFPNVTSQPPAIAYGESITSFRTAITIGQDGTLDVVETIRYDFGSTSRHGIFRDIPHRFNIAADDKHQRSTPITVKSVESTSPNTPTQHKIEAPTDEKLRIKIGDPNRTIRGQHTYIIRYSVRGALSEYGGAAELNWNATGNEWNVDIRRAAAAVAAPASSETSLCFEGPAGSTSPCASTQRSENKTSFQSSALPAFSGLTVVTQYPLNAFEPDATTPIIIDKPQRGLYIEPITLGATAAVGLLCFGWLVLTLRKGRDRQYAGGTVEAALGNASGADEPAPIVDRVPTPVQFEPPEGIRPGQIGTLIDGVAHPLDVTATIIDLATRGYLSIVEIPKQGLFSRVDWTLRRNDDRDTGDHGEGERVDDGLFEYERLLLSRLFKSGDEVQLSSLKQKFAESLQAVQRAIYNDLVLRRWFAARPDKVRSRWRGIGILFIIISMGVAIALALTSKFMLATTPIFVLGIAVIVSARVMPVRTAKGTALLRRTHGFKTFMESFTETNRAQYAERDNYFYKYLPYAIVFGCADHWAKAFEPLQLSEPDWYHGSDRNVFTTIAFMHAMDGFTSTSSGTISAAAASTTGGSGFSGGSSGGGFGGGGGGSW